jgi:GNAT superfamily N-acetyltransferase
MAITIDEAATPAHYDAGKALFQAYGRFLGMDLEFQGFSEELANLATMYGPPAGCLLLARAREQFVGAVGLREFEPGIGEMKRLFVLEQFQGQGAGALLTQRFIDKARLSGYRAVRLDTIPALDKAVGLYRKFGFREIGPYRYNPHPGALFMELEI